MSELPDDATALKREPTPAEVAEFRVSLQQQRDAFAFLTKLAAAFVAGLVAFMTFITSRENALNFVGQLATKLDWLLTIAAISIVANHLLLRSWINAPRSHVGTLRRQLFWFNHAHLALLVAMVFPMGGIVSYLRGYAEASALREDLAESANIIAAELESYREIHHTYPDSLGAIANDDVTRYVLRRLAPVRYGRISPNCYYVRTAGRDRRLDTADDSVRLSPEETCASQSKDSVRGNK